MFLRVRTLMLCRSLSFKSIRPRLPVDPPKHAAFGYPDPPSHMARNSMQLCYGQYFSAVCAHRVNLQAILVPGKFGSLAHSQM